MVRICSYRFAVWSSGFGVPVVPLVWNTDSGVPVA
jgi:hypothetical protein